MRFLSNFGCKIIFVCSNNFWHQQDSNSLFKGSILTKQLSDTTPGNNGSLATLSFKLALLVRCCRRWNKHAGLPAVGKVLSTSDQHTGEDQSLTHDLLQSQHPGWQVQSRTRAKTTEARTAWPARISIIYKKKIYLRQREIFSVCLFCNPFRPFFISSKVLLAHFQYLSEMGGEAVRLTLFAIETQSQFTVS